MLNLPLSRPFIIGPIILLTLCWSLFLFEPISSEWLAFDRDLIVQQQFWRLFSGNLLHTNLNHLLLNSAGVLLLWALHGQYFKTKQYLLFMTLLCLGTTLSIYGFAPQLRWYVGLSGALHGLFILGAYFDIKHGLLSGWLLLIGVLVKVAHEQFYGASDDIAELIGANVAIDAHLYGSLSALVIILLLYLKNIKR
ncbi:rhombosortase [Paraglaciecola hydrolytica]|uniref:Rhombosortase n=1 Tax=Paraglaciecola hydrolytica TaxID=1799789 RepID=A0A136A6D9_9ALTE|nr:rhombosortase [Paraglaciecola hydrolytica]KXI30793.1 rhombosortase [Paraglaciecola hydrolytica]